MSKFAEEENVVPCRPDFWSHSSDVTKDIDSSAPRRAVPWQAVSVANDLFLSRAVHSTPYIRPLILLECYLVHAVPELLPSHGTFLELGETASPPRPGRRETSLPCRPCQLGTVRGHDPQGTLPTTRYLCEEDTNTQKSETACAASFGAISRQASWRLDVIRSA